MKHLLSIADLSRDVGKSCEGVVWLERHRCATDERVVHECRSAAHGDEEISGRDAPRVDLHAGKAVGARLDVAEPVEHDRLERDHVGAPKRRSASRVTSRSSKGSLRPPIS